MCGGGRVECAGGLMLPIWRMRFIYIIFKIHFLPQRKHTASPLQRPLMMLKIIFVYSENHTKPINSEGKMKSLYFSVRWYIL
jgi:hypothetical protein